MTLTAAELVARLRAKGADLRVVDDQLDWPGELPDHVAATIAAHAEPIRRYLIAERFGRIQEFGKDPVREPDRSHLEFMRDLARKGRVVD